MIAAFAASSLFLVFYIIYHGRSGRCGSPARGLYGRCTSPSCDTHVLAATVPPLAIITLWRGLAAKDNTHRRIARWTFRSGCTCR